MLRSRGRLNESPSAEIDFECNSDQAGATIPHFVVAYFILMTMWVTEYWHSDISFIYLQAHICTK